MKVKVCVGARCTMMGSNGIMDGMEALQKEYFSEGGLEVEPVNCMNVCKHESTTHAPVVMIGDQVYLNASLQEISEIIMQEANIIKD